MSALISPFLGTFLTPYELDPPLAWTIVVSMNLREASLVSRFFLPLPPALVRAIFFIPPSSGPNT